jgi:hypothetical protein
MGEKMKHYSVQMLMSYRTEVIAESEQEAYDLAYRAADNDINSYLDLEEEDIFIQAEWVEDEDEEIEILMEDADDNG